MEGKPCSSSRLREGSAPLTAEAVHICVHGMVAEMTLSTMRQGQPCRPTNPLLTSGAPRKVSIEIITPRFFRFSHFAI